MIGSADVAKVEAVLEKLKGRGETVATAESCTGGMVATWLTHVPGSSAVFLGGVAAYANAAKVKLLGVNRLLLDSHGAVSAACAEAMADGVRRALGSTYAVSITGVAGPEGGSPAKPVGTVFCGIAGPAGARSVEWHLGGSRAKVREDAARQALAELAKEIGD